MKRLRQEAIAAPLLCLLATACVASTQSTMLPDQAAFAARRTAAEKLTGSGDLAEALVQWKVLETLAANDPEMARKRRAVEAEVRRRAEAHFDEGTEALAERHLKEARRAFLTVLALDPTHRGATEQLRRLEVRQIRRDRPKVASPMPRIANAKTTAVAAPAQAPVKTAPAAQSRPRPDPAPTSESLQQAVKLAGQGAYLESIPLFRSHLAQFPADDKATRLLATSHRKVGIALYNNGELEESLGHLEASAGYGRQDDGEVDAALADAKSRLAQQTYEQGVRVFRQDVAMAIALWEQTLVYDPAHVKAKSYLDRAYKIQQSLNSLTQ
jgi:tetratricopeptide (TPR) repeat protein